MATPQQEYEKLRATGLSHSQVMKRMSSANLQTVAKANVTAAQAPTTSAVSSIGGIAAKLVQAAAPVLAQTQATNQANQLLTSKQARLEPQIAPKQIQAEAGDTWDAIAEKIGVPTKSLLDVNPKDTTVKAGAVYNVPRNLPEGVGIGAGTNLGVGEDIADWWKGTAVPWLDKQRQAIYDWGTSSDRLGSGKAAEGWIGWGEEEDGSGGKPQQSLVNPFKPQAEYADFRKAESAAAYNDDYRNIEARRMAGTQSATKTWDDPFPTMPGATDYSTARNLYDAASGQMKNIYESDPTIRYGKFGFDILGLEAFERQDNMDAIAEIALEPFMKPFTANYLASFGNDVRAVWNENIGQYELEGVVNLDTIPQADKKRLVDLGYITLPSGGGVSTGGYGSSGVTARAPSRLVAGASYYGGRGYQDYQRNPAYLGLTSWSI